jgi:spore coat protein U-like protein
MFEKSIVAVRPFKLALLASIALAAAGATAPAFAASTTATASATVIVPIAIAKATDLSFGKFAAGTSAGSVTIKTDGTRTVTGVTATGGTLSAASFNISGEPSATYAIDTSATTANLTSGSDTLSLALVSDFTAGGASSGTQATGTLSGTGTQTLYVGGTLTVGANQANGSYSGSVSVAVAYN